jgi:hypothetical protein
MLAAAASAAFKSRATLHLENLALRHQLSVLRRSVKPPKLTSADRLLWACLCEVWIDWRSSLVIVKPETVIGWHRKGFQLFWTWKVRHGQPGRPAVSKETRQLIRKMNRENPLWGAPRIHGELLKLGIDIGQTSVGKYIVPRRQPPSQTWRTFLENHANPGRTSHWPRTRRNRGPCTRRHSEPWLPYRKLADFTTATSDAQPERSTPRRNSNPRERFSKSWRPDTTKLLCSQIAA